MGVPSWWERRRFGLMVHANLASVPAWAPIGEDATWYRAGLDGELPDVLLHASPMVETLAHHADRWAHVEQYDDFASFLTFDDFDPDAWASVALDAGAGYLVATARHLDGWCWWDAPATERTVVTTGPRRNVLGELAAACERADLVFGTTYSLLDWADERYPGADYVAEVVHPQVLDLVERYGSRMLWGDAHWGAGGERWRSNELFAAARRIDPDVVVSDRWWADEPGVATYDHRLPDGIVATPWETRLGVGPSLGCNRAERPEHLLDAAGIVAVLTEVVAKGGHLLVVVGADRWGRLPETHVDRLAGAGDWVRRHAALVERGRPWHTWGDATTRYVMVDGVLHAVDVGGRATFRELGSRAGRVASVTAVDGVVDGGDVAFHQTDSALVVERTGRHADARHPGPAVVYRVTLDEPASAPIELFPSRPAPPIELAPLLAGAGVGDIVQLGEGVYLGPARVPDGVVLRGLGPDRTTVDGLESTGLTLGQGSRVEHLRVRGGGDRIVWLPRVTVRIGGRSAVLLGCRVDGHVEVTADDVRIASTAATGVVARGVSHLVVTRSTLRGMQWDCAIEIEGGSRHLVESCELTDVLVAVRMRGTVGSTVRGNRLAARWWGAHVIDSDAAMVAGNTIVRTMRAVDVEGGSHCEITGNAVTDGDSGCVVERGSSDVEVAGNHWERCRVGLIVWDGGTVRHHDNTVVDLGEPDAAVVSGP